MKKYLKYIALVLFMSFSIVGFAQHGNHSEPKAKVKEQTQRAYTCPMHPEVHSDKPGKCLKCGMALVKKKSKTC
ncbi:heavy metal-binding domain-containing protein [Flavobacterium suzhouense]|uniref:Heavy metal-binding domain-containing protein n=1 Tax=Flavobacterium suzhouense TaxID=1529638 RepID=A0ABW5NVE7_9FLAO